MATHNNNGFDDRAMYAAEKHETSFSEKADEPPMERYPDMDVEGAQHWKGDIDEGYDPAFIKRVTRKIDLRLIPILSLMYCISLIDRTNLSITRQANELRMNKELKLIGNRYSIATIVL